MLLIIASILGKFVRDGLYLAPVVNKFKIFTRLCRRALYNIIYIVFSQVKFSGQRILEVLLIKRVQTIAVKLIKIRFVIVRAVHSLVNCLFQDNNGNPEDKHPLQLVQK